MQTFGPAAPDAESRRVELQLGGHLIEVIIHRPEGEPADINAVPFFETGALIDTGASDVCIDFRIAHDLNLRQIDQRTVGTLGGSIPAAVYVGVLEVPALGFKKVMPLYAFRVRRVSFSVVLGRTFLSNYIVTFNGPEGYCVFADPPWVYSPPIEDE
jgi:predicted aspartyl protease